MCLYCRVIVEVPVAMGMSACPLRPTIRTGPGERHFLVARANRIQRFAETLHDRFWHIVQVQQSPAQSKVNSAAGRKVIVSAQFSKLPAGDKLPLTDFGITRAAWALRAGDCTAIAVKAGTLAQHAE